jgi:hypothetical protein
VDSSNGHVYAVEAGGDIYKCTSNCNTGTPTFSALSQTSRDWRGISVDPVTHDVYATVYNGDIYKQTAGSGDFIALGQTSRIWLDVSIDSTNKNIYASVSSEDIYESFSHIPVGSPVTPVALTTTLGDGTDQNNSATILGPGSAAGEIDRFSLVRNIGSTTLTGLTVTLGPTNAYQNIASVDIQTTGGASQCSNSSISSNTVAITGCSISVTTSSTQYKVMITPKSHANMPAVPGASYATTATVTSITVSAGGTTGTDTDSDTRTVDNASPAGVTSSTVTGGDTLVDVAWTNPVDSDFTTSGTVVVLRRATSAVADVPVEGTTYTVGNTIGTATVACVVTGSPPAQLCQDTSLSNGTAYHYKIFTQDSRGNYDAGTVPSGSPATPTGLTISGTTDITGSPQDVVKIVVNGSVDSSTGDINSGAGTWSISPSVSPTSGETVLVFVDGQSSDADETAAVLNYDGTGNMTDIVLNKGVVSIGSANSNAVTLANMGLYDCDQDEDIPYSSNTGVLLVEGCTNSFSNSTLSVPATQTLTVSDGQTVTTEKMNIAGTVTATGAPTFNLTGTSGNLLTVTGTFTEADSTVSVESPSGSPSILSAAETFHILKINSGATVINAGANITTDNDAGNKLWIASGVFNQEGRTITPGTAGTLQVDNAIYCLGGTTGSTTADCVSGVAQTSASTFPAFATVSLDDNSTVRYLADAAQTIETSDIDSNYGNLELKPKFDTTSRIYTFEGAATIDGNFIINPDESGAGTPALTVNPSGTITVAAGKTTTISATNSATSTLDLRPVSTDYNLSTGFLGINTGGTLDATGAASTITLSGTGATLFALSGGTFTVGNSLVSVSGGSATLNSGAITFYDLDISGGATKTLAANITVDNTFSVSGDYTVFDPNGYFVNNTNFFHGTCDLNIGPTIRIDATTYSGNYASSSGGAGCRYTYEYTRAGSQTIESSLFWTNNNGLIISGNGTKTLNGNIVLTGLSGYSISALAINSGATLALGSNTVTLNSTGASVLTGSGTLDGGTGIVRFVGDGATTIPAYAYYNLELSPSISSGRTYTLDATSVLGNLNIVPAGSALLTVNMGADLAVTGTTTIGRTATATSKLDAVSGTNRNLETAYINIGAGGTYLPQNSALTLTGTSGTLFTLNSSGTFTPAGSTVDLVGNGNAVINSGTPTFYDLNISGTGVKTAGSDLTISDILDINNVAGAFHAGGHNITVGANITNAGALGLGAWKHYRSITIDHTKVPNTNQTNFPVLVSGIFDGSGGTIDLRTAVNGGKLVNSNGYDVAFFSDSALTVPLKFERETWSATTGVANYWVKVPTVSSSSDTVIYIAYGNGSITTDQSDSTSVWDSNFKGVWHLSDGTTLNLTDSTLNTNNGTNNSGTATTGNIDGGLALSGSSQYVNVSTNSSLGVTGDITISAWVKPTDFANYNGILSKSGNGGNNAIPAPYDYYLVQSTGVPRFNKGNGTGTVPSQDYNDSNASASVSSGVWTHIAVTMAGSNNGTVTHYKNGSTNGSSSLSFSEASADGGNDVSIGSRTDAGTMFKGSLDEVRLSSSVRSADWIATEYNNQSSPSTFYTIGSETTAPSPALSVTGSVTNSGVLNFTDIDTDAQAFLTTTSITDVTISNAVNNLVKSAKTHGWWDKADAIYPFVTNGTDNATREADFKLNLKDPRDDNTAFRLSFNGTWTHTSNGADPNGSTGYADTHISPSTNLTQFDHHLSYYSRENFDDGSSDTEIGVNGYDYMIIRSSDIISAASNGGTQLASGTNSDSRGFFLMSRTANNNLKIYGNGVQLASNTNTETGALPSNNIFIGALNSGGSGINFSNKQVAFATIGDGISSTLAGYMYDDVEAFQTALGRNVSGIKNFTTPTTGPTVSVAGTGTVWNNTGAIVPGLSTIKLTDNSITGKTFAGGGATYNNLWLAPGSGTGSFTISGNNTFNDFKDNGSAAHSILFTAGSTQTLSIWNVSGANADNRITIDSTTTGTHNLVKTGTADIVADFLNIQHSIATPFGEWLAGTGSVNNQSIATAGSGWMFNTRAGSRGGGNGNAGGESSGGGSPVGGGTGQGSGGGSGGGEGGQSFTAAVATANLQSGGVNTVTVNSGGSGYTSTPTVYFCGGGGSGATATATRSGTSIQSVAVNTNGSGYTSAPTVQFGVVCSGGSGSGGGGGDTGYLIDKSSLFASVIESINWANLFSFIFHPF